MRRRTGCLKILSLTHLAVAGVFLLSAGTSALALESREAEFVPIKAILEDPQQYNVHRVRIGGTITKLTVLPNASDCGHFDGYVFLIEDDTGRIEVFDLSVCEDGGGVFPPLLFRNPAEIGDRVSIAVSVVSPTIPPGIRPHGKLEWIRRLPENRP